MAILAQTTTIDAMVRTDRLFRARTGRRAFAVGGANEGGAVAPRSRSELTSGVPGERGSIKRGRGIGVHAFHLLDSNRSRGGGGEGRELAPTSGTLDRPAHRPVDGGDNVVGVIIGIAV